MAEKRKKKEQRRKKASFVELPDTGFTEFIKNHVLESGILIFAALVLYGITYSFGYVLDDRMVFSENSFVLKGFSGIKEIFSNDSFVGFLGEQQDLVVGARYRPLSLATFAIEQGIYGAKPGISHLINVLLYGLTGLYLFRLLTYTPGIENTKKWTLAFFVALLFVAHPIHSEVVANIKGRDEILTLLFSLLATISAVRYARTNNVRHAVTLVIWYVAALFSKENAVMFLFIIPLTLYYFELWNKETSVKVVAVLLLSVLFFLSVRTSVIGYFLSNGQEITGIMNNPFYGLTSSEKFGTIFYSLGYYLRLFLVPWPLTHDYYPYQIVVTELLHWRSLGSVLLYSGLIYFFVRSLKQKAIYGWGIAFFGLTLVIVSNIFFPTGAPLNERFMFAPSAGLIVAVLWSIPSFNTIPKATIIGVSIIFGLLTIIRVPAWKDALSLNEAAIKVSTNSARANSYYGYSLYRLGLETEDSAVADSLFKEARPYVERALEIYPGYTDALTAKAGLLAQDFKKDGDLNKLLSEFYAIQLAGPIEFVDTYLKYLESRVPVPTITQYYHLMGYELFYLQKRNPQRAMRYISWGLQLDPSNQALLNDRQQIQSGSSGAIQLNNN